MKNKKKSYRDTDTVDAEVTKTQDARAVRHYANLRVRVRPVAKHGADRFALLDRDVEGLGARVQGRVLQADVANRGRVHKRHEFPHVINEDAVKEVDVLVLEVRQIQVLVDIGRTAVDHLHGPSALRFEALHDVGNETGEVLGHSLFGSE